MKAALIQLPLQSHDYAYSQENIPLAAGYLAAYASAMNAPARIVICPPEVANLGGDAAVLEWIEEECPDLVGFSCYLWNVQRTLSLCSELRLRLGSCTIVLGGPEVTPDNEFLLSQDCFDIGVVGEGEQTFVDLIHVASKRMRNMEGIPGILVRQASGFVFTGHRRLMDRLDAVVSPYLAGILAPGLSRGMVLETVRGCPMRCAYCYYHKRSPDVRTFEVSRIRKEIAWAVQEGIEEVTIVDPCFARRPRLHELLAAMTAEGSGRLRFSCELNAEDVTQTLVDALLHTGLSHVEIGLQSTSAKTLKTIKRPFVREGFIRGVKLLRHSGIRVMTDVMVGLPGDSLEDVKRTIDFVLDNDLCDDLSLYPLSVLPGTKLRHSARRLGINHQLEPPYLVNGTPDMDCSDIRMAFSYASEAAGRDFFPVELPYPTEKKGAGPGMFVGRIVVEGMPEAGPEACRVPPGKIGQALCIEVRAWQCLDDPAMLEELVSGIVSKNPFTLLSWVIPEKAFRREETTRLISSLRSHKAHPADSEYMSAFTPLRSCQLFVRSETTGGGPVYTQVPLGQDASRPVWAALPLDAGPDEELRHRARMEDLLGYRPAIRFYDLEPSGPVLPEGFLGAVVV